MIVRIFDYGAGNLHSLAKAIARADGVRVHVDPDPISAAGGDVLVLPGVGAFGAAAARLAPGRSAIRQAVHDGLPVLGICLGMQLLFEGSDEGEGEGLGVIAGRVTAIRAQRVPQIGWNTLDDPDDPLLERSKLEIAYFANGFACRPEDPSCVRAWSEHGGDRFPALVRHGSAVGAQFHPEKSSVAGVAMLRAFLGETAR
jgi:imidazole glycerol-phosphate synthase subunit HisH